MSSILKSEFTDASPLIEGKYVVFNESRVVLISSAQLHSSVVNESNSSEVSSAGHFSIAFVPENGTTKMVVKCFGESFGLKCSPAADDPNLIGWQFKGY